MNSTVFKSPNQHTKDRPLNNTKSGSSSPVFGFNNVTDNINNNTNTNRNNNYKKP